MITARLRARTTSVHVAIMYRGFSSALITQLIILAARCRRAKSAFATLLLPNGSRGQKIDGTRVLLRWRFPDIWKSSLKIARARARSLFLRTPLRHTVADGRSCDRHRWKCTYPARKYKTPRERALQVRSRSITFNNFYLWLSKRRERVATRGKKGRAAKNRLELNDGNE